MLENVKECSVRSICLSDNVEGMVSYGMRMRLNLRLLRLLRLVNWIMKIRSRAFFSMIENR